MGGRKGGTVATVLRNVGWLVAVSLSFSSPVALLPSARALGDGLAIVPVYTFLTSFAGCTF